MLTPSLFNDSFDLFDRFYRDPWFGFGEHDMQNVEKALYGHRAKNVMKTDVQESENSYDMTVDLPGFNKDEVSVVLENGYLTISASKGLEKNEAENEEEQKKGNYIRRERYSGSCQRSFYVGEALEVNDIKAKFEHGVLKLTIPKEQPKQLVNNKYVAIEG